MAPVLLAFNTTPELDRKTASEDLRRHYLGVGTPADAKDGLLRLFADRHVVVPALRAVAAHALLAKQPVHLYRFGWSAALGRCRDAVRSRCAVLAPGCGGKEFISGSTWQGPRRWRGPRGALMRPCC